MESKIKLQINIKRKENNDEIDLKATAFCGLLRYTITIPFLDLIRQSALIKEKKLKFIHVLANILHSREIIPRLLETLANRDFLILENKFLGIIIPRLKF